MDTRQLCLTVLLMSTLLWACQKEKQVVTKLPEARVAAVGDSVAHLPLTDSLSGKYIVSGYLDQHAEGQNWAFETLDTIYNDTVLISKKGDSLIACSSSSNSLTNIIVNIISHRIVYQFGMNSFSGDRDNLNFRIAFPRNHLDSVYISYAGTGCDRSLDITLSGTKIH